MKKMTLRRTITFFVFLLFPLILYYFSPYLSIVGALNGVITASVLMFALLFVLGLFFGRAPCSWFMPCGGMQDACASFQNKDIKAGKKDRIKYIIFIPWFLTLVTIILINIDVIKIDPFFRMPYGISISQPWSLIIIYSIIFVLFALVMILGKRGICHYVCWMAPFMIWGRKLGNALKLPGVRLQIENEKCISCRRCSKACPMGIDVQALVEKKSMNHDECILCGECVPVCVPQVLHLGFHKYRK